MSQQRRDFCDGPTQGTMVQDLARARDHIRAVQWAFAHHSMVVNCDECVKDESEEDGWDSDDTAPQDPSTPDWRGRIEGAASRFIHARFRCPVYTPFQLNVNQLLLSCVTDRRPEMRPRFVATFCIIAA